MCISAASSFDYDLFRPLFADKIMQEFVDRIYDQFLEYPAQTMQLLTQCLTLCGIVAENGQVLDVSQKLPGKLLSMRVAFNEAAEHTLKEQQGICKYNLSVLNSLTKVYVTYLTNR